MQLSTAATKWCPHRPTATTTTITNTADMQCHFLCHRKAINLEHINMDVRWKCQPNMSLSVLGSDLGIGIWIGIGIGIWFGFGFAIWYWDLGMNRGMSNGRLCGYQMRVYWHLSPEPRAQPKHGQCASNHLPLAPISVGLLLLQMKWRKKKVSAV